MAVTQALWAIELLKEPSFVFLPQRCSEVFVIFGGMDEKRKKGMITKKNLEILEIFMNKMINILVIGFLGRNHS